MKTALKLPRAVYLTHGEDDARTAMKALVERELGIAAVMPAMGEEHDLDRLWRS
ncbi:MAG: hypothetical protein U0837_15955 [Dehalococcoidia bacterium]